MELRLIGDRVVEWSSSLTLVRNPESTMEVSQALRCCKRWVEVVLMRLSFVSSNTLELIRWTKGFGAPNVEGHDVAAMFEKSLKKYVSRIDQMSVPDYMFLIRPFRAPTERPNQDDRLD